LSGLSAEVGETPLSAITVYWRPGCGYCFRLLRSLERDGIKADLRNIWEDDEAREFVRQHNRGDETVPTVVVGDVVLTNPEPKDLISLLRADHPQLVTAEPTQPGLISRLRRQ
jgi:mycoredoxin